MKALQFFRSAFVLMCLAFACGCAGVQGIQKPVSGEDYLQSARAQLGAVYQTIGDLKALGSITQAQSKAAIVKAESAEAQLDQAAALVQAGNQTGAQQLTGIALTLLVEIQSALPKPKGK